jgi:hypothetical protein
MSINFSEAVGAGFAEIVKGQSGDITLRFAPLSAATVGQLVQRYAAITKRALDDSIAESKPDAAAATAMRNQHRLISKRLDQISDYAFTTDGCVDICYESLKKSYPEVTRENVEGLPADMLFRVGLKLVGYEVEETKRETKEPDVKNAEGGSAQ